MDTADLSSFLQWLDSYLNFEKLPQKNIFWLDTMRFLCGCFGHPELACPSFHVAGSKGKGSISALIAGILEEAGFVTGLYTSPHILAFTERIARGRGFFDASVYEVAARELQEGISAIAPEDFPARRPVTWFELVTLYAMLCFRKLPVDMAVYEVGLGGRLDATNVIRPLCCCIGPIELEHTEYLGDTVEAIAAEKAGIIKDSVPVISAPQQEGVRRVFHTQAWARGAPLFFSDDLSRLRDIRYVADEQTVGMEVTIDSPLFRRPVRPTLRLLGDFQAQNAAVAALAVKTACPAIPESCIERGLSNVRLQGRFELVSRIAAYPHIARLIMDGAHTPSSVRVTMETFHRLYDGDGAHKHLLFACARDKDIEEIAPFFAGVFSAVTLTRPGTDKQADLPRAHRALLAAAVPHIVIEDHEAAVRHALLQAEDAHATVLVTGSFYLIAELKRFLALTP